MTQRARKKILAGAILFAVFIVYTLLVKKIDVKAIGEGGAEVGFAALNGALQKAIGVHNFWYYVTEVLGILAIALAAFFALVGLMQLIRGKSFAKVSPEILAIGALYVVVILFYIIFEKVVINYRPVLMKGEMEASYPSSHTMLALCVFGSAVSQIRRFIPRGQLRGIAKAVLIALMAVTVLGRILSGVHWFTDILGGTILSLSLLLFFYGAIAEIRARRAKEKKARKKSTRS